MKYHYEFLEFVTLENKKEISTHLLVVMIRGMKQCWKQVTAYEVTGNSVPPSVMKHPLGIFIEFIESAGLCVVAVTSMDISNVALCSHVGVKI